MPLKRVVLTVGSLDVGGTEGQIVLLAQGLTERGIQVAVASLFRSGPYEVDLRRIGIPVYSGRFPSLRREGARALPRAGPEMLRFISWLRSFRPDLVHAFLYHAYVVTPPAARCARVPRIVAGRRSLGSFKRGRRSVLALERAATSLTDLLVANSHAVAREALHREHLRPDKVAVIHNGIRPAFFQSHEPAELPHDGPLVLCVANFRSYKGHRHLIDSARLLHAQGLRFTLALAGEGDERASLEARAATSGADIRFLGSRRDVARLLAAADIVVLPSLEEGFSNTVLEAMAAGRPVVATDVGGNAEALGDTGVLVAPGDACSMASGLRRLLCDPAEAKGLGAAARCRALKEFSADAMVDRHVELYESLVA